MLGGTYANGSRPMHQFHTHHIARPGGGGGGGMRAISAAFPDSVHASVHEDREEFGEGGHEILELSR
jgi:hypothetical protein